jgi:mRNA-degrading endonuclease RelE of RelBE toxin-antitoxin system
MATVQISPSAQKQLHALPVSVRSRIRKVFVRLEKWPDVSGVKALSGNLAGRYRIRTGDYRVQFRVIQSETEGTSALPNPIVIVEKVGHRSKFYED